MFARILEEAARATGDDCFGLHFGERFNPKNIGPLAYTALNSPTVGEADAQVARYIKLYNQAGEASVIIEGQRAYMRYVLTGLDIPSARQQNEYGMAIEMVFRASALYPPNAIPARGTRKWQGWLAENLKEWTSPSI